MKAKICPKCKNTDIDFIAGGGVGLWKCKKCGFTSALFPEKEIKIIKKKNVR